MTNLHLATSLLLSSHSTAISRKTQTIKLKKQITQHLSHLILMELTMQTNTQKVDKIQQRNKHETLKTNVETSNNSYKCTLKNYL